MNILVTGSEGFLGRHLCAALQAAGHTVAGVDLPGTGAPLQVDLTEHGLNVGPYDHVVHLAGLTGRRACAYEPTQAVATNVGASWRVARACARAGVPLLYASSSEVYGYTYDTNAGPLTEAAAPRPASLYGWTKLWGEQAVAACGPPLATIARLSMPYGPGHPPGPGRAAITNWLWSAQRGYPLVVHPGARSWCYIADTVEALRRIIEQRPLIELGRVRRHGNARDGQPWIVHVGRDDQLTENFDVAALALELASSASEIKREARPGDIAGVKQLSMTTLRLLTGWQPQVPLRDGMQSTLGWLRNQEEVGKL